MRIPRIMITSISSGSGKTTAVCGLMKALLMRGMNVKGCKCGPDYIDPMFHKKVLGVDSQNIDLFFVDEAMAANMLAEHSQNADITVFEGVMGYYDGMSMESTNASSFDIAQRLAVPSVLIINARGMALSAAAVIKGFAEFKNDSKIKGFILNNVSKAVYERLKPVIEENARIKGYGYIPPLDDEYRLESRHLGLIMPDEIEGINEKINKIGGIMSDTVDIDGLIRLAEGADDIFCGDIQIPKIGKIRTAAARDAAFCFYYAENIRLLEKMGCEIVWFSPLNDKKLPDDIQLLIIGGGYPELYLERLCGNKSMLSDIKNKLYDGLYCLAECGGFMYLGKSIKDSGREFETVGFLDGESFKTDKLVRFGYIDLRLDNYNIKAHEFHYWDSTQNGDYASAQKPNGKKWSCMVNKVNTLAGFPHMYYHSNIGFIADILKKCRKKRLIAVMGGSGSGKSEFAENTAVKIHKEKVGKRLYYLAAMIPEGSEAQERIKRHRLMRSSKGFETFECYAGLKDTELDEGATVLIECMSNLLANEMFYAKNDNAVYDIKQGIEKICRKCDVVVVTNNIFSDGNIYDDTTTMYMKNLACINSYLAKKSDTFAEIVYSVPIYHKRRDKLD